MARPLQDSEPTRWTAGEIRTLQEEGEMWRRSAYELQRRIDELGEALMRARECCTRPEGCASKTRAGCS